jgi:hypothetical protein
LEEALIPMSFLVNPLAIAMPTTPVDNLKATSILLASCRGYVENNMKKNCVVESNKLKKMKHTKSWLVQLAMGTKRKVVDFIPDFEFSLDGKNIKTNQNIFPLGSYDVII